LGVRTQPLLLPRADRPAAALVPTTSHGAARIMIEAHYWARQLPQLGHRVRLIPPAYVKPFVRRQKNDANDAEAICEAAQRPSMRFVAVKSEQQQAAGLVFRTRDLLKT
jgi:transposase